MLQFCKVNNCHNRLVLMTGDGKLKFQCTACATTYDADSDDTLIKSKSLVTAESIMKYQTLIRLAAYDVTNPLVRKTCPECKNNIVSMVSVGDEEETVYVCKCGMIIYRDNTKLAIH